MDNLLFIQQLNSWLIFAYEIHENLSKRLRQALTKTRQGIKFKKYKGAVQ